MRTLFISDLDGTLLQPNGRLSVDTIQLLNQSIAEGAMFTFATARTASTAIPLTEALDLSVPVILQNGVLIYDPVKKERLIQWSLSKAILPSLIDLIEAHHAPAFLYAMEDYGKICAYYTHETEAMRVFRWERETAFKKHFEHVDRLHDVLDEDVTYLTLMDTKENLDPISEALRDFSVKAQYYSDVYHEGIWFLEIYHQDASKGRALAELRRYLGSDLVIAFGDNYNDLPLFEAAHKRIAVGNAVEALQAQADLIIGPNTEDSVAHYIQTYRGGRHGYRSRNA